MTSIARLFSILAVLLLPGFASAEDGPEDVEELAGHRIVIDGPFSERTLSIDGRKVHEDAFIAIQHRGSIDGVDFVVGTSSAGGNACEGSPFVISAAADAEAKFEGPIDSCAFMNVTIEKDRVLLAADPLPDRESERWEWKPGTGLHQIANEAFVADRSKGWAEVEFRVASGRPDGLRRSLPRRSMICWEGIARLLRSSSSGSAAARSRTAISSARPARNSSASKPAR